MSKLGEAEWKRFKGSAFSEQAAPTVSGRGRTLARNGLRALGPSGYGATGKGCYDARGDGRPSARFGHRASGSKSLGATGWGYFKTSEKDDGPSFD